MYTEAETVGALLNSSSATPATNPCGCSEYAACHLANLTCECTQGYGGEHCFFLQEELPSLQANVTAAVANIQASLPSLAPSLGIAQLEILTRAPDALTNATALLAANLTARLLSADASAAGYQTAFEVLSHLSRLASSPLSHELSLTEAIKAAVGEAVNHTLASHGTLLVNSSRISASVAPISPSSAETHLTPSNSSTRVTLPRDFTFQGNDTLTLVSILYHEPIYQGVAPARRVSSSEVLTLELYRNGLREQVTHLARPILMEFAVDATIPGLQYTVDNVLAGLLEPRRIQCYYYDEALRAASTRGCHLVGLTVSHLTCACSHMTDFMGFLEKGWEVLRESNYDVWEEPPPLETLKTSIGFYFVLTYIASYLLFFFLSFLVDRRKLKTDFFQKLLLLVNEVAAAPSVNVSALETDLAKEATQPYVSRYKRPVSLFAARRESEAEANSRKEIIRNLRGLGSPLEFQVDSQPEMESVGEESCDSFARARARSNTPSRFACVAPDSGGSMEKPPNPKKVQTLSKAERIRQRLEAVIGAAGGAKSRCGIFGRLARAELAANNQFYNLVTRTSPLSGRPLRLTACYLALLLEFALCALFFSLGPPPASEPAFWERVGENFWVALYSTVFAMAPLLVLGFLFAVPRKWVAALQSARQPGEV